MSEYQETLRKAILAVHGSDAVHVASVPIKETIADRVAREAQVEVFDLVAHPTAKRSYAWGYPFNSTDEPLNIFTVLEAASITSPQDAFHSTMGRSAPPTSIQ
ncbi:MAG: hypothetical protein ABI222_16330 [Opitutaceae bacterium]